METPQNPKREVLMTISFDWKPLKVPVSHSGDFAGNVEG